MTFSQADAVFAYLYGEGTQYRAHNTMGAHPIHRLHSQGAYFSVWAPEAQSVTVAGEFGEYPMRRLGCTGVWEVFISGLEAGMAYQFAVTGADGICRMKRDAYGFAAEKKSVICNLNDFSWNDGAYMKNRAARRKENPAVSVCPVADYEAADMEALRQPYTHLAIQASPKGGLFTVNDSQKLMAFIDRCHQNGLGVILDWEPGIFAEDEAGLTQYDGTALYGQNGKIDFSKRHTWSFLLSNALFWADAYHADGLKMKGLAEMLNRKNHDVTDFIHRVNAILINEFPGFLLLTEDAERLPKATRPVEEGGLGFHYIWNKAEEKIIVG